MTEGSLGACLVPSRIPTVTSTGSSPPVLAFVGCSTDQSSLFQGAMLRTKVLTNDSGSQFLIWIRSCGVAEMENAEPMLAIADTACGMTAQLAA